MIQNGIRTLSLLYEKRAKMTVEGSMKVNNSLSLITRFRSLSRSPLQGLRAERGVSEGRGGDEGRGTDDEIKILKKKEKKLSLN